MSIVKIGPEAHDDPEVLTMNADEARAYCKCMVRGLLSKRGNHDPVVVELAETLERLKSARALRQLAATLMAGRWAWGAMTYRKLYSQYSSAWY